MAVISGIETAAILDSKHNFYILQWRKHPLYGSTAVKLQLGCMQSVLIYRIIEIGNKLVHLSLMTSESEYIISLAMHPIKSGFLLLLLKKTENIVDWFGFNTRMHEYMILFLHASSGCKSKSVHR